ncbi:PREDICTED: uncharacterized protein LOC107194183 [Dufourea novaeangliae]|uniref:uncharacterized protein LOC107194183 n=1 Tax=Dufourea novaeangliae TaxID=178035 RepID=UPI000767364C|nr:PREDICTED: uncharacterized protein LOC107194183 [Dufourea novaeangliae]
MVAVLDDRGLALEGETIDREERVNVKSIKLGDGKGKHRRVRMADEGQQEQRLPKERKMIGHLPFLMKILEVILSVFAIGLIVDPLNSFQRILIRSKFKLDDAAIIYISIAGYIIINTLFIICHFLGDRIPKRTLIIFTSVGALLHIVAGSVIVYNWNKIMGPYYNNNEFYPSKQYMDMFISGAVFTFVNALVFIVDIVLTIRYSGKNSQ